LQTYLGSFVVSCIIRFCGRESCEFCFESYKNEQYFISLLISMKISYAILCKNLAKGTMWKKKPLSKCNRIHQISKQAICVCLHVSACVCVCVCVYVCMCACSDLSTTYITRARVYNELCSSLEPNESVTWIIYYFASVSYVSYP
jgi:hypothetical protein